MSGGKPPRLVGVGVGPGDPDLLTLAGLRELGTARRVFVPVLAPGEPGRAPDEPGRAEAVVRAHLGEDAPTVERLVFALADAVDGPQQRRRAHWDAAAERVAGYLREHGGTAAFATLGDPAVYSTFTYLAAGVRALLPEVDVATVPGITAMQAAACAAGLSLVEGAEPLSVVPVARDVAGVREALYRGGTVVAYKCGSRLGELRETIAAAGALERSVYAEHLGTPDETVMPLSEVDLAEDSAPYLSTVVILPPRCGRGEQL